MSNVLSENFMRCISNVNSEKIPSPQICNANDYRHPVAGSNVSKVQGPDPQLGCTILVRYSWACTVGVPSAVDQSPMRFSLSDPADADLSTVDRLA